MIQNKIKSKMKEGRLEKMQTELNIISDFCSRLMLKDKLKREKYRVVTNIKNRLLGVYYGKIKRHDKMSYKRWQKAGWDELGFTIKKARQYATWGFNPKETVSAMLKGYRLNKYGELIK